MKTIMIITLYIIGAIVFVAWTLTSDDGANKFIGLIEELKENNPLLKPSMIYTVVWIVFIVLAFFWPYFTVRGLIDKLKS